MFPYAFSINVCVAMCVREHPCSPGVYTRATSVGRVSAHARIVSLSQFFLGLNHCAEYAETRVETCLAITPRDSVASTRACPSRLGSPRGRAADRTRDFRNVSRIFCEIPARTFLRRKNERFVEKFPSSIPTPGGIMQRCTRQ